MSEIIMKKSKKNISSAHAVNKSILTPKDIKIIEKDAKGLINFIEEILNLDIDDDTAVLN